jgi:hypothetical protein
VPTFLAKAVATFNSVVVRGINSVFWFPSEVLIELVAAYTCAHLLEGPPQSKVLSRSGANAAEPETKTPCPVFEARAMKVLLELMV